MSYADYERWKNMPIEGDPYLSIVIPAYNEEIRIVPTIGAIASYISEMGFDWELIIADDGSTDRTILLLESLRFANMRILRADRNGGKGSAVRRGVIASRGKYILFTDADSSTPIEEMQKLLEKLEYEGYDIAIGSRAMPDAQESHKSLTRHVLSSGLRSIVRYGLRLGVRDTQCGFKLYRHDVGQRLHRAQTIDGFSFDLEILYLATKLGYHIAETPVKWIDAPDSKVQGGKVATQFMLDLVHIKMNDIRGVYSHA
jgi:dolichyl-phosphate beta-glucosyltransferase